MRSRSPHCTGFEKVNYISAGGRSSESPPRLAFFPRKNSISLISTLLCITNGKARASLKLVIARAMIGGLVTAIILHAIGADIHHYEAAHNNTRLPLLIYYWGRMLS